VRFVSLLALTLALPLSGACADSRAALETDRKERAERFLRGVYGCDPSVLDELASEDVVSSYPVFEKVYGTPALRGREAIEVLVGRFCERWTDARLSVADAVAEGDRVVLVWTFEARPKGAPPETPPAAWGGITRIRFDEAGRIVEELGEESTPGPIERLSSRGAEELPGPAGASPR